ncbi:MAG: hypothetical protein ISR65_00920 [Bacteriovoracaceae bacterium]|nr:hypothetical protein [Bacteriovoracaceae bacterium]
MITEKINSLKKMARKGKLKKRISVIHETKFLHTLYNWWVTHDINDGRFVNNPIKPKHRSPKFCTLRPLRQSEERLKQMDGQQLGIFLNSFKEGSIFRDFAWIHFFCGGRVSEPAALCVEDIDIQNHNFVIKRHLQYGGRSRELSGVGRTKTKNQRNVHINPMIAPILKRRINESAPILVQGVQRSAN